MRGCLGWIGANLLVLAIGGVIALLVGWQSGIGWFVLGVVLTLCGVRAYAEYRGDQDR